MRLKMMISYPTIALLLFVVALSTPSSAEQKKHHALSLIGTPKYGPDFKHFDFVNPNAPKGGIVRTNAPGTFETLNPFPTEKGIVAAGLSTGVLFYEPLMRASQEEPSASYGLIAEWISHPDDYSSATFKLRKEAKWHDGKPITVEDVIFTFNTFKKINIRASQYYKNVTSVKKTGEREVTFYFDKKNNRELPLIISQLRIAPKHFWTGKDKNGKQRDISKASLEIPLGSGPYKVVAVDRGKSITYERVKDYWGKDLPINRGQYNFDQLQFRYFFDTNVAFQAFKNNKLDYYEVYSSKTWATQFNFGGFKRGDVKKQIVPEKAVRSMQAFVMNTRRNKFADPNVRQALNLLFDFEWTNRTILYGQYTRLSSFFDETELAATGLPKGKELAILNEVKDQVPPEVFTTEYKPPVNGNETALRQNMRKALQLLKKAGWTLQKGKLVNQKTGKQMTLEILLRSAAFERVVLPYAENLRRIGIKATARLVDGPQYRRRLDKFDYDMIVIVFAQSFSPGNEQRYYWGSQSADQPGSYNFIGIKNPAIDKIIDKIIFAKNREDLVAATRALDRVLLWNHYVVPQWYAAYERITYWKGYAHPKSINVLDYKCLQDCLKKAVADKTKVYTTGGSFLSTWWYEPKKQ